MIQRASSLPITAAHHEQAHHAHWELGTQIHTGRHILLLRWPIGGCWWLVSFQAESACQLPVLTASLPAAQLQSGCKEQLPMRRVSGVQDSPEHFLTYPLITGRKEDGKAEMATLGEFACS